MGIDIVGIERKAALKIFFGSGPVPIKQELIIAQGRISFSKLVVDLQSPIQGFLRLQARRLRRQITPQAPS